jgi:hypothetical protein
MKHYQSATVIILFFLIESCALFKGNKSTIQEQTRVENDTIIDEMQALIDSINGQLYAFSTMQAVFIGDYVDQSSNLPLKGVIRISHDHFIWISIRPAMAIEASRILINKDSILILDRLNNQYYSESYRFIEDKFKIKANFEMLESIFSGKMFFYPTTTNRKEYLRDDMCDSCMFFKLYKSRENDDRGIEHYALYNKSSLLLKENRIQFTETHQSIEILYDDYKVIDQKKHYSNIQILGNGEKEQFKLRCTFENFVFNTELTAPFKIPENYKRVKTP